MGVLITLGCPAGGLWTHVAPECLPYPARGRTVIIVEAMVIGFAAFK